MKVIETHFHWISGLMFGLELVQDDDFPEKGVKWGIVMDLFVLRVMLLFREVSWPPDRK